MWEALQNVGLNVGLNKTEKEIIRILIDNSDKTLEEMAAIAGVSKRTIECNIILLQQKGIIERIGSKKKGSLLVVK